MLVLTADRPPELRDVGAPQAIDQTHLYGRPCAGSTIRACPTSAARGVALARRSGVRGRPERSRAPEPPVPGAARGSPGALPPRRRLAAADITARRVRRVARARRRPAARQGLVLAGAGAPGIGRALARRRGRGGRCSPGPRSGARHSTVVVTAYDSMLRHAPFAARARPEVVVRVGRPSASKVLAQWIAGSAAPVVQVGGPGVDRPRPCGRRPRPDRARSRRSAPLSTGWATRAWARRWADADQLADHAIEARDGRRASTNRPPPASSLASARGRASIVVAVVDADARPRVVRRPPRAPPTPTEGPTGSTASCRPPSGGPWRPATRSSLLVGDVAFVHDSGALTGLAHRGVDLRIVVVDNDGGGIFSFLPQASDAACRALRAAVRDTARHRCRRPRRRPRARRGDRRRRRRRSSRDSRRPARRSHGSPAIEPRNVARPRRVARGGCAAALDGVRAGSGRRAWPGTWPASRRARRAGRCRRRCRHRR